MRSRFVKPNELRGRVDVGILTIREDEQNAVLDRFPKVDTVVGERRRYRIRSLALPQGESYTLAVLRCVDQGTTEALAATRDLLEDLDPAFLLVVGIAGGVPAYEFTLGDVVVSTRIHDFSVEAVLKDGAREYALAGGPLHPDAAKLAADISAMAHGGEFEGWNERYSISLDRPPVDLAPDNLSGGADWEKNLSDKLDHHFVGKPPRAPLVTAGAVASSDRLMKNAELLQVWLKVARQVQAVEMESAGVYKAAHGRVPFLAIRGISDVVGFKRHPDWTTYACHSAAAFTRAFLLTRPIEPRGTARKPAPTPPKAASDPPPAPAHELPRLDAFVGRNDEARRAVDAVLASPPTPSVVIGTAGIGKTTLTVAALRNAAVEKRFGARRWFVRLEAATTADAAIGKIAEAIGVSPRGDALTEVCAFLARGPALLVLDNLESPWDDDQEGTEALLGKLATAPELALMGSVRGAQRPAGVTWAVAIELRPLDAGAAEELFLEHAPKHRGDNRLAPLLAKLDGIPLAIVLLARVAEADDLDNLAKDWDDRRTALLAKPGAKPHRLTSWAVSIDLSFTSKRMTPEARRLAALLARLPDGIASLDLGDVFPGGRPAARALAVVGLAYFEARRLQMLAPIREHFLSEHPAETENLTRAMGHYRQLALTLGPKAGAEGGADAVERLAPEVANLDAMIRLGLGGDEPAPWIDAAVALTDFARFSGRFSPSPLGPAREAALAALDVRREAACIQSLGSIALDRSDHETARERFEMALPLFQRVGDVLGEANCIRSLGSIALARSDHETARERFEMALPLFQRVGDVLGEANCIRSLGSIALARSDHETARERFEMALPLYQRVGDVLGEANCIRSLGDIALARSDHETARERFEMALPLYQRVGSVLGEANCIRSLGDIALRRSDHETARERFEMALPLYQRVGSVLGEANCIRSLGSIALARSDHETARERFEMALPLCQRVGDVLGEANCIQSLGSIALARSDHETARERFEMALPLYQRVGSVLGEANCIQSLGDIALRRSDHKTARERFEMALPLYQRVGDVLGEANCIQSLGDIALRRSDHKTARERFEMALPLYQRVGDVLGEANCIQSLGDIALRRSDHETARERIEMALPLYQRVGDVLGEANCIQSLGDIALRRSDHETARERFEKALGLYARIPEPYSMGQSHRRLARLAADTTEKQHHIEQARTLWTSIQRADLVAELDQEFPRGPASPLLSGS